ncbi:MAG: hypothetical protein QOF60_1842 [Actinomycetota bacterium]|jgi:hypothetical protein|nr:hypothetical protein [Actinomycetota bacterium]
MWWVPVGIAGVGAVPVFLLVRRVGREAQALRRSVANLADLKPPIAELQAEARALHRPRRGPVTPAP